MSLKKKLAMGIATGALAVSMIGGGTYAYFNDVEFNDSKFTAGTLDINVEGGNTENAIIDVGNLKPGDTMTRNFTLNNPGSLDVSKVLLTSKYTVDDPKWDNKGADFGKHINVTVTNNENVEVVSGVSLKDLAETNILGKSVTSAGSILGAGKNKVFTVKFEFVDNGANQNIFQGDSIKLEWKFDAKQTAGSPQ